MLRARSPGTSATSRSPRRPRQQGTEPACGAVPTAPRLRPAGRPEVVCRAVQFILDGALDGKTEHDLAARLFISTRHLRRLFQEHLGVTPDQLARSSRTHFARRLLDDTDLTIADIAFASGFGSIRQLNRACREVFRAAPSQLRARRWVSDRLVADGGLALRLPFLPPLDWDAMLGYFDAHALLVSNTSLEARTGERSSSMATPACLRWRRVAQINSWSEPTYPTGRA